MSPQRSYQLHLPGGLFAAAPRSIAPADETPLPPPAAWRLLEQAFARPRDLAQLTAMAEAIGTRGVRSGAHIPLPAVRQAILSGEWVLTPSRRAGGGPRMVEPAEPAADQMRNARRVLTWIEVEVVDDAGRPAAGREYRCMLPDGTIQTGTLDRAGRVRFEEIDPGNCSFSLVDTHAAEWDRAA